MSLLVKSTATKIPVPAGLHRARCVQIVDLGTQQDTYQGKVRPRHVVKFTWEFPTLLRVFNPEKGEQPFFIQQTYTCSIGKNSTLREVLEEWRGKQFTEEELKGFELKKVLGAPCQILITHVEQDGTVRARVKSIGKQDAASPCPPAISPLIYYEVEMGQNDVFKSLPDFMQEDIKKCEEWSRPPNQVEVEPAPANVADESVPF